ncbi:hypothetical protein GQR58_017263 [Nymphon striatum]|nr:hypothetical protein GQR58_017263 [Nymphon striatum]
MLEVIDSHFLKDYSHWMWLHAKLNAAAKFLSFINSSMKKIIESSEITLKTITPDIPLNIIESSEITLKTITSDIPLLHNFLEDIIQSIPDAINATTNAFHGNLFTFMTGVSSYFSYPHSYCHNGGLLNVLKFSNQDRIKRIDNIVCNFSMELVNKTVMHPVILFFTELALTQNEQIPKTNWTSMIASVTEIVENVESLKKLKIIIFPDIRKLGKEIESSVNYMLDSFNFLTIDDKVRYFLGNVVDQVSDWFNRQHGIASLRSPSKNLTYVQAYNKLIQSSQLHYVPLMPKFVLIGTEIFLKNVNEILTKYSGKSIRLSDVFTTPPFTDIIKTLENIQNSVPSLIRIIQNLDYENLWKNTSLDYKLTFPVDFEKKNEMPTALYSNMEKFMDAPPTFADQISDAASWSELRNKYFSDKNKILSFVLGDVFDMLLSYSLEEINKETQTSYNNFRIAIFEGFKRNDPLGYISSFLNGIKYGSYSLDRVFKQISVHLKNITEKGLNVVNLLPDGPFKVALDIVSKSPSIYTFLSHAQYDAKIIRTLMEFQKNGFNNTCQQKATILGLVNHTDLLSLVEDIFDIACMNSSQLQHVLRSLQSDDLIPVQIFNSLNDIWYRVPPNEVPFSLFNLQNSIQNFLTIIYKLVDSPPKIIVPDSMKASFDIEVWKETLFNLSQSEINTRQLKLVYDMLFDMTPVFINFYDHYPVARKFFNVFDAVAVYTDKIILNYNGMELNFTKIFEKSPEMSEFANYIEKHLPEILSIVLYSAHNASSHSKFEELISPNFLQLFCDKPWNTYLSVPAHPLINVSDLHTQFCSYNFSTIDSELTDQLSIEINATDLDLYKFTDHLHTMLIDLFQNNISFSSDLFNKSRWTDLNRAFINSSNALVTILAPLAEAVIVSSNNSAELRPLFHLVQFFVMSLVDHQMLVSSKWSANPTIHQTLLSMLNVYIGYDYTNKTTYIYYKSTDQMDNFMKVIENLETLTKTGLYSLLQPEKLSLFVKMLQNGMDPKIEFCNIRTEWKDYFFVPDNSSDQSMKQLQKFVCNFQPSSFLNESRLIKYVDLVKRMKENDVVNFQDFLEEIKSLVSPTQTVDPNYSVVVLQQDEVWSNTFTNFWNKFLKDKVQKIDTDNEIFDTFKISGFISLMMRVLPKDPTIENYILTAANYLKTGSEFMEKIKSENMTSNFSTIVDEYIPVKLREFFENNLFNIIRVLMYSNAKIVVQMLKLGDFNQLYSEICTSPEQFFYVPPNTNIDLNHLVSEMCSMNFTINLSGSQRNISHEFTLNSTYEDIYQYFGKELTHYIQNAVSMSSVQFSFPLSNLSSWNQLEEDFFQYHSFNNSQFYENHMKVILEQLLTVLQRRAPIVMKFLAPLNASLTISRKILLNFDQNDIQREKLKDFVCNFDLLEFIDIALKADLSSVYEFTLMQLQNSTFIDPKKFLYDVDQLVSIIPDYTDHYRFSFNTYIDTFYNLNRLISSIRESSYNRIIAERVTDVVISTLYHLPSPLVNYVTPLVNLMQSLSELVNDSQDSNITLALKQYPMLQKFFNIVSRDDSMSHTRITTTFMYIFTKLDLQLLPDFAHMWENACHQNYSKYAVELNMLSPNDHREICNVLNKTFFMEFKQLILKDWKSRELTFADIDNLNKTIYHVIDDIDNIPSIRSNFFSHIGFENLFTPVVSYIINVTSVNTPMKYFWEIVSSTSTLAIDLDFLLKVFLHPDEDFTFYVPNFISEQPKFLSLEGKLSYSLNVTKAFLDIVFDPNKTNLIIEDLFLKKNPFEAICQLKNLSKYFDDKEFAQHSPYDLQLCRHYNKTAVFDRFTSWYYNLKNAVIGKVDPVEFIGTIMYWSTYSFSPADQNRYDFQDVDKWRKMLQDHLAQPFENLFIYKDNIDKYLTSSKENFEPVAANRTRNKSFDQVFKDSILTGEIINTVTDANIWQRLIEILAEPQTIANIFNSYNHHWCDQKMVYVLGMSPALSDSLVNIQHVFCNTPEELKQEIFKILHVKEISDMLIIAVDNTVFISGCSQSEKSSPDI